MKSQLVALARGRVVRVVAAAVVGAVAGLVIFELTRIGGRGLFVTAGAVAGVAGIALIQIYHRSARLTEVKVSVPQVSELTFVVNNESRNVAWKLFVETVTRVSTQPLAEEEGLTREALTSCTGCSRPRGTRSSRAGRRSPRRAGRRSSSWRSRC